MDWYLKVVRDNYFNFEGRARRKEYWMFFLFNVIIIFALSIIESTMGMVAAEGVGILSGLYGLAVFLPALGVAVRRLHDTNKSGWWVLVGFVPLIGFLILLVLLVLDSTPGDNRFGPNPKGVVLAQAAQQANTEPAAEIPQKEEPTKE